MRQFNKVAADFNLPKATTTFAKNGNHYRTRRAWNENLTTQQKEIFVTSTNIWQGKKLGMHQSDLKMFEDYYHGWRAM